MTVESVAVLLRVSDFSELVPMDEDVGLETSLDVSESDELKRENIALGRTFQLLI